MNQIKSSATLCTSLQTTFLPDYLKKIIYILPNHYIHATNDLCLNWPDISHIAITCIFFAMTFKKVNRDF